MYSFYLLILYDTMYKYVRGICSVVLYREMIEIMFIFLFFQSG